jgi:metal-sulfur cluster biosynthetic enzyme
MVSTDDVMKVLDTVVDPELGMSITALELVDKLDIEDGKVKVAFHLTAPYCPPVFALQLATDVKTKVAGLDGVKKVEVALSGHFMADEVNKRVNAL